MIPNHAVVVWAEGQTLVVHIPGTGPEHKAHYLRYPLTGRAFTLLVSLLRDREEHVGRIVEPSAPTKKQLEAALADAKVKPVRHKRGKPLKLAPPEQQAKIKSILAHFGIVATKRVTVK